jgi:shikimate dehydrogenase
LVSLLGWPVAHSRSPAMHNAAFARLGLDFCYLAFAVGPERLGEAIAGLQALGARGANITIPHKVAAVDHCTRLSEVARQAGAVNTLVMEPDGILGDNTDVDGLAAALAGAGADPRGRRCAVLGAGGAARAAALTLLRSDAAQVVISARNPRGAEELCSSLAEAVGRTQPVLQVREWGARALESAEVIIGAIPPQEPLALDAVSPAAFLMDLAYPPASAGPRSQTPLVEAARARGLRAEDGRAMLVHQGALSFQRWTGQEAPLEVMWQALGLQTT